MKLGTPRLYVIADHLALAPRRLEDAVAEMAEAGVEWIQLRAKRLSDRELFAEVEACARRLEGGRVKLWIDDRADVARLVGAAGVHVGQQDLPPAAVRLVVGAGSWIGLSTHDADQARAAEADPEVDLVAAGPVFPTRSKDRPDPVLGLDGLRRLRMQTRKPLAAIGGIGEGNLGEVLAAGADVAVVLSAACLGDVRNNCRRLLALACRG